MIDAIAATTWSKIPEIDAEAFSQIGPRILPMIGMSAQVPNGARICASMLGIVVEMVVRRLLIGPVPAETIPRSSANTAKKRTRCCMLSIGSFLHGNFPTGGQRVTGKLLTAFRLRQKK